MATQPFTVRLENGSHVIRDHMGVEHAKVGTIGQAKAVLKTKLGFQPGDELNIKDYQADELKVPAHVLLEDGPFLRDEKWYYRVGSKQFPKDAKDAYKTQEAAQAAYNNHE